MRKKLFFVSTPLLAGIIFFFILIAAPAYKFSLKFREPYNNIVVKLASLYRENIPPINYSNFEARSNDDKLFQKIIKGNNNSNLFTFFIDTAANKNLSLKEEIKAGNGGLIIYRDSIVFYESTRGETEIKYKQLNWGGNITIDDKLIKKITDKFGNMLFNLIVLFIFVYNLIEKFVCWLIIALAYSGKAKISGGGNYSLALWALVFPSLYQVFMEPYFNNPCCFCGLYYILLVVTALILGYLWQKSIDEKMRSEI